MTVNFLKALLILKDLSEEEGWVVAAWQQKLGEPHLVLELKLKLLIECYGLGNDEPVDHAIAITCKTWVIFDHFFHHGCHELEVLLRVHQCKRVDNLHKELINEN